MQSPVDGSHTSPVHGLPSSAQETGEPATQLPDWQESLVVQPFPSSQGSPLDFTGFEHSPVAGSHTPA